MIRVANEETIKDVGEFGLIERVTGQLSMPASVSVGPGDDSAVFSVDGDAVVSTDMMVEDVHFRRDWCSGFDVGCKLIARSFADLEAMGATSRGCVVAISMPEELQAEWFKDFFQGVSAEVVKARAVLVGGDITSGEKIVATATVFGQMEGRAPVLRSGAKPADVVALCGRQGWAAAGWATLSRGFRSPRAAVDAYRCPEVPYGAGRIAAAAGANAMIDVSDGLIADLGHIAEKSNVLIDIDSSSLEIPGPLQNVGAALNSDPLNFVLTGGEDHPLVATFADYVPQGWAHIGRVLDPVEGSANVLVDGEEWETEYSGWTHF